MRRFWMVLGALVASGCSGRPGRLAPPKVDPDVSAVAAIEQYDRNQDGRLGADELAECPGLAHVLPRYDTDGNGSLTSEEIAAGMRGWAEGKMGATPWPFRITFNGRALEGAHIKLIPEPFLGGVIKQASGESSQAGRGALGMAPEDLPANAPRRPLVQPGLYRVEITHPSVSIPARYNIKTTLGLEVASYTITPAGAVWELTSGN